MRGVQVSAMVIALVLGGAGAPAVGAAPQADVHQFDATIRRDGYGVPHVVAGDFASLAFGIGYAFAQDNICTLMDYTVTVSGERSRWFGPNGTWTFEGNGTTNKNLDSDFFYESVNRSGVLDRLLAQPPPHGPLPEIRASVTGYAAGINRYLGDVGGAGGIADPRCHGAPWVRPLTEQDVYRRFFQLASMASAGVAITGIAQAQPPTSGVVPVVPGVTPAQMEAVTRLPPRLNEALGIGSNAYALGRNATDNGMGMVLGNPHFPWQGGERLYQMHLTIPGRVNVSGAGLYGVPLVLIGHTDGVAWSHTVSTAYRFTPFELILMPGSPTTYLVDGQPEAMTQKAVTIKVKRDDGSLTTATRTLWQTRYGPMFTSLLGLPLFPWTPAKAYALGDANVQVRYLNQFFLWNQAHSTDELFAIQKQYLGIPWVNTIAADRAGKALYSDVSVVPNVPDAKATACAGALGAVTFAALGLPTLDGSRSACGWDTDPDAPVPGIFGPSHLPHLFRADYVTNSNDSFWLSNPKQPLEGFARIIGDVRTERSLRTRLGLVMVEQRLAGADQYAPAAGKVFTQDVLQDVVFNNRQYAGELVRDDVVALCRGRATVPTSAPGTASTAGACDALAGWNRRDDLDSKGAILFRRFWGHLASSPVPLDVPGLGAPWRVPFNAADPVHTPRDLDTDNPRVALALGDAITDLNNAGIPLNAPLRGWQYKTKNSEKIPIHGGPGGLGVFNAIAAVWNGAPGPKAGYSDVRHGSSFVMVAHFVDPAKHGGCPVDADAIVTYSQSEDATRPFFANETRMYSNKQWNPMYFCEAELAADPGLTITRVSGGAITRPTAAPLPVTGRADALMWTALLLSAWVLARRARLIAKRA